MKNHQQIETSAIFLIKNNKLHFFPKKALIDKIFVQIPWRKKYFLLKSTSNVHQILQKKSLDGKYKTFILQALIKRDETVGVAFNNLLACKYKTLQWVSTCWSDFPVKFIHELSR